MKRTAFGWVALWLALLGPLPAHAYLIDLNDAAVLGHGRMALELAPIGYFQTIIGDQDHQLVVPSFQLYLGVAEDVDLIYVARGYALLGDRPDEEPFTVGDQMLGVRSIIRHGAYSSDDAEGPSVVFQSGFYLPDIVSEAAFGISGALLVTQQWDELTWHGNVWVNLNPDQAVEVFVSTMIEAPWAWPVRPTAEVYFDVYDGEPYVSGLVGVVGTVTDDFWLQGGVRVGGWEDYMDLEVRLSSWIEWEVWVPPPPSEDEESDASETEEDDESESENSESAGAESSLRRASASTGPSSWLAASVPGAARPARMRP